MHSRIPIIALTADVTTVDLAKCKAVGMNDYIAKPVDERLLYSKIVGLVKKASLITQRKPAEQEKAISKKIKCTNLEYLTQRTKSNPKLMMEMISLYLEQTPTLVKAMKLGLQDQDWKSLQAAAHKMIPSFSIMGMSADFETMARQIQEDSVAQQNTDRIQNLVIKLEKVSVQACNELKEEFNRIKNAST